MKTSQFLMMMAMLVLIYARFVPSAGGIISIIGALVGVTGVFYATRGL